MQTDKGKDLNVMMIKPIGGLTASNAAFNVMSAQQSMLGLLSFAGSGNANPAFLAASEAQLQQSILQNSLMYKLGLAQEKVEKKLQEDNIKRSFSTFA